MRVLLSLHSGAVIPGGHAVQAAKTASALRELGVDVTVADHREVRLRDFDVVHAFGLPRQALREAREGGAVIVLSPIHCAVRYLQGREGPRSLPARVGRALQTARVAASVVRRGPYTVADRLTERLHSRALDYEIADLLLPNSQLEAQQIRDDFGTTTAMHVVPNAVDPRVFTLPSAPEARREGILYVGRLEPHKNQLGLIQALRGSGHTLTIAGPEHPHHHDYAAACRRAAGSDVHFHPGGEQSELVELYQRSRLHVLPSWYETTGLVSLEAALCGAAVVTTDRGYAREYFQDLVEYCDPGRPASIRSAVERGLDRADDGRLRQRVLGNYTWEQTAKQTLQGYQLALSR